MFDRGAFLQYDSYVANGVMVPSKMMAVVGVNGYVGISGPGQLIFMILIS
jgi:hypothetical protein